MTTSNDDIAKLRNLLIKIGDHAVACKALMHDAQDQRDEWHDKYIALKAVVDRQRKIIAKLEAQLGIDQDL